MKIFTKNSIKYSLIMSGIIAICLLSLEVTGNNQTFEHNNFFNIIYMLAPVVVWFLGIRAYKKQLGGIMTWKQGTAEGFRISLAYAIVSPFVFLAYYLLVNPEIIAFVREAYKLTDSSDSMVIFVDMVVQFVSAIIFGTIIGMICALILKTKSTSTPAPTINEPAQQI